VTRVLVLNGPNLATLGTRETAIYGHTTLAEIEAALAERAAALGVELRCEQSNHEGALVDLLEQERERSDGCVLNPAGLAHTSVVLADAVRAFGKPVVEVHLSNIHAREPFRRRSLTAQAAAAMITGLGAPGYVLALEGLVRMITNKERTA
jgi:3-dehydroquinate dehydratase II